MKPNDIERLVLYRLITVSTISIFYDLMIKLDSKMKIVCCYILLLQFTLMLSILKPMFGVKKNTLNKLDIKKAFSKTVTIPTPKRSLLLAMINLFEIILSWGIIYKTLIPGLLYNSDKANYFSIVTLTTVGYGDLNGSQNYFSQIAVSLNLIIFIIFSICHITTILGTLTNEKI